ncbi:MAG: DUF1269 domain-containing protein [Nitrososphaerota archaeon]
MTLGPVHLVMVGLRSESLKGQIARELHRASEGGAIRILDALAIQKTPDGSVISLGASDLTPDERIVYGAVIGGLMGFGATGTEEGAEEAAELGALAFAERNFGLSDQDIKAIANELPSGMTALVVLIEHRWAIPLKEALQDAGGVMIAQGIVRPEDLVAFGARLEANAEQAERLVMPQSTESSRGAELQ